MPVQYEIKITGRVQGVGYRYFVQNKAAGLKIAGWVKNMPDGSVLVTALGDEENMDLFFKFLKSGPSMARVDNIVKSRMPENDQLKSFQIKY